MGLRAAPGDGQLLVHDVQAVLTLTPTTMTVGNVLYVTGFVPFGGIVQTVAVWDIPLSGSAIAACQLPFFPTGDIDPIAACDFSVDPPVDLVSGVAPTLVGNAALQRSRPRRSSASCRRSTTAAG